MKIILLQRNDTVITGHLPETKIELYPQAFTKSTSNISDDDVKFPKEKRKLFLAFLIMVLGFLINDISIVLTHQKVPDKNLYPPLPDVSLDNITKIRWLNDLADILVIISILMSAAIVILHRHR